MRYVSLDHEQFSHYLPALSYDDAVRINGEYDNRDRVSFPEFLLTLWMDIIRLRER